MLKVFCVFGTRPEAIKMAPVVHELRRHADQIESRIWVTAQHREMLDQVLETFNLVPDLDLNLMRPNQTLAQVTSRVLLGVGEAIQREKPDWILIQGDTTTVMATSLAAFYHRVRIGHIEAGLRTWDKYRPFPEEVNRKIADAICDLHFAPTETARANLLREGIAEASVVVTGNTVIDALLWVSRQPFEVRGSELEGIPFDKRIILVTAHRRENFGQPIRNICRALRALAERHSDIHLVYPVHRNPNILEPVHKLLSDLPNITLLPPLPYRAFVHLMKHSYLVLTDSGGLQEELPSLDKPVLVLRDVTERPEAVQAGAVRIVGTDTTTIVRETGHLLADRQAYEMMARAPNPYGDGQASQRIVKATLSFGQRS